MTLQLGRSSKKLIVLARRLYFASQVTKDGGPVPYPDVDGEEHGKVYYDLVQSGSKADWDVRFLGNKAKV